MKRLSFLIAVVVAALSLSGCLATVKNEQMYGAAGGAAGAALCSKQQNLLGLCVIGGYILGSKLGAKEDAVVAAQGTTKCKAKQVTKFIDGKRVVVQDGEICDSQVVRQGYRNNKLD